MFCGGKQKILNDNLKKKRSEEEMKCVFVCDIIILII